MSIAFESESERKRVYNTYGRVGGIAVLQSNAAENTQEEEGKSKTATHTTIIIIPNRRDHSPTGVLLLRKSIVLPVPYGGRTRRDETRLL